MFERVWTAQLRISQLYKMNMKLQDNQLHHRYWWVAARMLIHWEYMQEDLFGSRPHWGAEEAPRMRGYVLVRFRLRKVQGSDASSS
jgi:hypothetical protein